jgi:large subunit ribosomal protein L25
MAQQTQLTIAPRTVMGKATKRLRREGILPANIYGHKSEPTPVQLSAVEFDYLIRKHETRGVLSLVREGAAAENVLIRHVQHEPSTGKILHIDFTRVSLRERIEAKIPLNIIGEAPGVKIQGGVLLHQLEAIAVECTAADIVDSIDLDVSGLEDIDSTIYARDVKLPARYTLITDPDEPVVKVIAPRVELPETTPTEEEQPAAAEEGESAES